MYGWIEPIISVIGVAKNVNTSAGQCQTGNAIDAIDDPDLICPSWSSMSVAFSVYKLDSTLLI